MTNEDIIRMAREAGFCIKSIDGDNEVMEGDRYHIQTDVVARFAALVAAAERERIAAEWDGHMYGDTEDIDIGAAIRARGNT